MSTTVSPAIEINRAEDLIDFWLLRARDVRASKFFEGSPILGALALKIDKITEVAALNAGVNPFNLAVSIRSTDPDVLAPLPLVESWIVDCIGSWGPSALIDHKLDDKWGGTRSITNALLAMLRMDRDAPEPGWGVPAITQTVGDQWCAYLIGDGEHGMLSFARSEKQREAFAALGEAWRVYDNRSRRYWQSVCLGMTTGLVEDVPDDGDDYGNPQFHNGAKVWGRLQGMLEAAASGDVVRIQGKVLGMRYMTNGYNMPRKHPFHEYTLQQKFAAIMREQSRLYLKPEGSWWTTEAKHTN